MKRYFSAIGILLIFGTAGWYWYHRSPLSSDESLIAQFERHRPTFEELVQMVEDDRNLISVYEDFVSIRGNPSWKSDREEGFSTKRWNEYKALFGQLGIHFISVDPGIIYFEMGSVASTEMDANGESIVISKSYAYSNNVPQPLVESLNDTDFDTARRLYRRIDENWYLCFDRDFSKPE